MLKNRLLSPPAAPHLLLCRPHPHLPVTKTKESCSLSVPHPIASLPVDLVTRQQSVSRNEAQQICVDGRKSQLSDIGSYY